MSPLPEPLSAIILAGGRSTRFGSDKASALLAGRPLLEWVAIAVADAGCTPIVVVRARRQRLPALTVPVQAIDDFVDAAGPLAGLVAGLRAVSTPLAFVTSCDAPLLQAALVRLLAPAAVGFDAVCPQIDGHPQPLVAVYRMSTCLPAFEAALAAGVTSLRDALATMRVSRLSEAHLRNADPELASFRNANRPDILAAIERELGGTP